jgi:hypothetical protein
MNYLTKSFFRLLVVLFSWNLLAHADGYNDQLDSIELRILEIEKKVKARKEAAIKSTEIEPSLAIETPLPPTAESPPPVPEFDSMVQSTQEPQAQMPSEISSSNLNLTEEKKNSFESQPYSLNRLNFHLGLTLPSDTTTQNGSDWSFDTGTVTGIEYQRYFLDQSYICLGLKHKAFEASGNLTSHKISYSGDCSVTSFYGTLGQSWSISDDIQLLTQASAGFARSDYEFVFKKAIPTQLVTDTSFYYSLLFGLYYEWNQQWQSSVYYEFDGRSDAGNFGYHSFHTFGISTSFGF